MAGPGLRVTIAGLKSRGAVIKPDQQEDPSEDLARWLKDVGRRVNPPRREPDEAPRAQPARAPARTRVKNLVLAALLAVALLQYYFIEVQLQILSQPTLMVFVPPRQAGS